jgi:sulfur dioxygenase
MIIRQLIDHDSSTFSYLLADSATREAVIIDAVLEQFDRDRALIEELGLALRHAIDTHVHADHITALGLMRAHFGAQSVVSERSGSVCPDRQVKHGDQIEFGRHRLQVRETPGHTSACITLVCDDPKLAFTGDALLIRGCGRTDFQQGDAATLYRSVREQIFSLSDDTLIYPAHDYKGRTVTSVGEEKRFNPRLKLDQSEAEFVRTMAALALPYPRQIDVALPANLHCGVPSAGLSAAVPLELDWAPITVTSAGVPEIEGEWLAHHRAAALLLDVREPDEYRGELGHLPGATLVPLGTLSATSAALARSRPIVTICRSGGRSGKAALALAALGFPRVASLRGGMRAWNAQGLPVEYGAAAGTAINRQDGTADCNLVCSVTG